MTVWNLGSVNIDHVYRVPHLPAAGETLAAIEYSMGLGGKGANQSVAAARAGRKTCHIGAIGPEGTWARNQLAGYGVDVTHVSTGTVPTGHAIIYVDPSAENAIVIFPGANRTPNQATVAAALEQCARGDTLLLQNETSAQLDAARIAQGKGVRVIYSAAPFEVASVRSILPFADLLVMNAGEAEDLRAAFGGLPEKELIVTRGAAGAEWISPGSAPLFMASFKVVPIDTTGAGDCFIGTLAAGLDAGLDRNAAMRRAAAAAAIQVTRPGAAQAMPTADEVSAFLS